MSEYQQQQASWEWMDQVDERWYAENISGFESDANINELAAAQPIIDQMLSNLDSALGQSKESN